MKMLTAIKKKMKNLEDLYMPLYKRNGYKIKYLTK